MTLYQGIGLVAILLVIGLIVLIALKGKDLLKLQMLQGSFFKQLKFSISTPNKVQRLIHFTEEGYVSQDLLPVSNGWIDKVSKEIKMTWILVHCLKVKIYKDGIPYQDEEALLATSRCYIPLDPFNLLGKNRDKLTSLSEIGGMHHDEVMFATGRKGQGETIQEKIINGSFVYLSILTVAWFFKQVFVK